jgi:uncharacterized hydrophobic protein (TIGR00271 family)
MKINILNEISDTDKNRAVEILITNSSSRQSYYFMVALSVAMATMGLLLNSTAVVIGSMLIAPVLYPVLSLAMGIIISDTRLVARSFATIVRSLVVALVVSVVVAIIFSSQQPDLTSEIIKRTQPTLLNFAVALVAGLAVSYAIAKPNVNESMPGVAISVSLVPPLAVIGVGLARLDLAIASPALILFVVNVIGIMFSAMIIFSLMQFVSKRLKVQEEVVKDDMVVKEQANNY